jgi:Uma2 family endonuclease
MATAAEPRTRTHVPEKRFLITNVGWDGYEALLRIVGDRPIRITYDRGDVELMSPSIDHEKYKGLFARVLWALTEELEIPRVGLASMTWRRKDVDRGLEADECFYVDHAEEVMNKKVIDLTIDPPPDLAIEIDITSSSLDREGIYAALKIPEIWRFDGDLLRVARLTRDGTYQLGDQSFVFPWLPLDDVAQLILEGETGDQSRWGRRVRRWVREEIAPRLGKGPEARG